MRRSIIFYLGLFVFVTFVSCSDDDSDNNSNSGSEIKNQKVQGVVKGKDFVLAGGNAFKDTFNGQEEFQIYLFDQPGDCEVGSINFLDKTIYELVISIAIARKVAVYDDVNIVSYDLSETEGFGPSNILQSQLEITEITETTVSGKLRVDSDGGGLFKANKYEGTFTVPICESKF